jgi:hypothetical protein
MGPLREGAAGFSWNIAGDLCYLTLLDTLNINKIRKVFAMADQGKLDDVLVRESTSGHTEAVKALLEAGADVHAWNDQALRYASLGGHTETVKALLEAGANAHADNDLALFGASRNGHTEVVKLLLVAGADVHAMDSAALREAGYRGHRETEQVLVAAAVVTDMRKRFKEIGVELTKEQAVEGFEFVAGLVAKGAAPARPAAKVTPGAPAP